MGAGGSKVSQSLQPQPQPQLQSPSQSQSQSQSQALQTDITFDLYLIRHGISCANVIKKQPTVSRIHRLNYTDPELTKVGRLKAIEEGTTLKDLGILPSEAIVGSSVLMRAQQTAVLMMKPSEIYIIPYVSEVGPGNDNTNFDFEEQTRILNKCGKMDIRRNTTFYEEAKDSQIPNLNKFKQWLGQKYRQLNQGRNKNMPLCIFTHHGFIDSVYKDIIDVVPPKISNYSVHKIRVVIQGEQVFFQSIQYNKPESDVSINIDRERAEESCRKPIFPGHKSVCPDYSTKLEPRLNESYTGSIDNTQRIASDLPSSQRAGYTPKIKKSNKSKTRKRKS